MKRRKSWVILLVACVIVPFIVAIEALEDLKESDKKNEAKEQIFVFPSMKMEGISANSNSHVPQVEVNYRGQPFVETTVSTTTSSSSEVITSSVQPASIQTTRGK